MSRQVFVADILGREVESPGMGAWGVEGRGGGGTDGGTDSLSLGTNCKTTAPLS